MEYDNEDHELNEVNRILSQVETDDHFRLHFVTQAVLLMQSMNLLKQIEDDLYRIKYPFYVGTSAPNQLMS